MPDDNDFDENRIYNEEFERGADHEFGPAQGFNEFVQLNDPELFTDDAKAKPVVQAFLDGHFKVSFVQYKSSYREAEWHIHKPQDVMAGNVEGIVVPESLRLAGNPQIGTYVINHEATLARSIMRAMRVDNSDGTQVGQIIYKQPE